MSGKACTRQLRYLRARPLSFAESSCDGLTLNTMETMTRDVQPTTLGLVAGLGVGAGIFYYRSLVNAHLTRLLSPHIVMVHANVQKVMGLANARESHQLADYLVGLLGQLAGGGAQFATIPAFSPQVCPRSWRRELPFRSLACSMPSLTKLLAVSWFASLFLGPEVTIETGLFGRLQQVTEVISPQSKESTASAVSTVRS